jgi:hypothetical protein
MNIGWCGEEPILCERIARFKDEFGNWRCAYHWDIEQTAEEERRREPPSVALRRRGWCHRRRRDRSGAVEHWQYGLGNRLWQRIFGFFYESAGLGYMAIPVLVGSNLTNT